MDAIYPPREDSFLLQRNIRKYVTKQPWQYPHGLRVMDMCTGTGVQAKEARKYAKQVVAIDVNPAAKAYFEKTDIAFIRSDLFAGLEETKGTFDLILCNPPYLPNDKRVPDIALDGGKKGHEFIERFLEQAKAYLALGGTILLLFSSLTKKRVVENILKNNNYLFRQIDSQKLDFEELFVFEIARERFLARGRRGAVYQVLYDGKLAAMKVQKRTKDARFRLEHEAHFLKIVNAKKIGPKLHHADDDKGVMEYIDGEPIADFLRHAAKKDITAVIRDILRQCRALDELRIDKEEMNHPYKHIIVRKRRNGKSYEPVMIDFERARKTPTPKNVTQICQFVTSSNITQLLKDKRIFIDEKELRSRAAQYKGGSDAKKFRNLIQSLPEYQLN